MSRSIPFLNLKARIPEIKDEILARFSEVIDRAEFVSGANVAEFEAGFAGFLDARHVLMVNSGTTALQLALMACRIKPGDEVILPVNTFIGTAEAVSFAGATPVFCDVDPDTQVMGGEQIEPLLTERTRVILPVHLFGQCADMDSIEAIATPREIVVIEDAAQAHGARYKGRCAGTLGDAAAFSFFPSKNLGCWGESGAITTNDPRIFENTKLIRDHGSTRKYEHAVVGGNFRSNEFQGIVLGVKLRFLGQWNDERKRIAALYTELLAGNSRVRPPLEAPHNESVWHLYVVRVDKREAFREQLQAHGIQTAIHYPIPLHLSGAYQSLGHRQGDFPVAERLQSEVVSLPIYPGLPEDDVRYIAEVINRENW